MYILYLFLIIIILLVFVYYSNICHSNEYFLNEQFLVGSPSNDEESTTWVKGGNFDLGTYSKPNPFTMGKKRLDSNIEHANSIRAGDYFTIDDKVLKLIPSKSMYLPIIEKGMKEKGIDYFNKNVDKSRWSSSYNAYTFTVNKFLNKGNSSCNPLKNTPLKVNLYYYRSKETENVISDKEDMDWKELIHNCDDYMSFKDIIKYTNYKALTSFNTENYLPEYMYLIKPDDKIFIATGSGGVSKLKDIDVLKEYIDKKDSNRFNIPEDKIDEVAEGIKEHLLREDTSNKRFDLVDKYKGRRDFGYGSISASNDLIEEIGQEEYRKMIQGQGIHGINEHNKSKGKAFNFSSQQRDFSKDIGEGLIGGLWKWNPISDSKSNILSRDKVKQTEHSKEIHDMVTDAYLCSRCKKYNCLDSSNGECSVDQVYLDGTQLKDKCLGLSCDLDWWPDFDGDFDKYNYCQALPLDEYCLGMEDQRGWWTKRYYDGMNLLHLDGCSVGLIGTALGVDGLLYNEWIGSRVDEGDDIFEQMQVPEEGKASRQGPVSKYMWEYITKKKPNWLKEQSTLYDTAFTLSSIDKLSSDKDLRLIAKREAGITPPSNISNYDLAKQVIETLKEKGIYSSGLENLHEPLDILDLYKRYNCDTEEEYKPGSTFICGKDPESGTIKDSALMRDAFKQQLMMRILIVMSFWNNHKYLSEGPSNLAKELMNKDLTPESETACKVRAVTSVLSKAMAVVGLIASGGSGAAAIGAAKLIISSGGRFYDIYDRDNRERSHLDVRSRLKLTGLELLLTTLTTVVSIIGIEQSGDRVASEAAAKAAGEEISNSLSAGELAVKAASMSLMAANKGHSVLKSNEARNRYSSSISNRSIGNKDIKTLSKCSSHLECKPNKYSEKRYCDNRGNCADCDWVIDLDDDCDAFDNDCSICRE